MFRRCRGWGYTIKRRKPGCTVKACPIFHSPCLQPCEEVLHSVQGSQNPIPRYDLCIPGMRFITVLLTRHDQTWTTSLNGQQTFSLTLTFNIFPSKSSCGQRKSTRNLG